MSGVSTLFYDGTDKFVVVSCLISLGHEIWRHFCCFVLPVVDLCLSFLEGYSSSRDGAFVILFAYLFSHFILQILLDTSEVYILYLFIFLYIF
jgi:hypothetical protein